MRRHSLTYEYGFGDLWKHVVALDGRVTAARTFPICVGGQGHGVAENVWGRRTPRVSSSLRTFAQC